MGLAHILGLDGGERWLCRSCGRFVTVEADDVTDGRPSDTPEDGTAERQNDDSVSSPECPNCGSRNMRRITLF